MAAAYDHHSVDFKLNVLSYYQEGVRGHGAKALATRFDIKSPRSVRQWAVAYDGTRASLEKKTHPNRKRKLSVEESTEHIRDFVVAANRAGRPVSYPEVRRNVIRRTGINVSASTVRRYGYKDHGLTSKRSSRHLQSEGTKQIHSTVPARRAENVAQIVFFGAQRARCIGMELLRHASDSNGFPWAGSSSWTNRGSI